MAKTPPIKRPKFGGARKTSDRPPSQKANEEYGMKVRKKASDASNEFEPKMGNREFGFIQSTPKLATASMSGRGLPPLRQPKGSGPARASQRKQFKPRAGKKVF